MSSRTTPEELRALGARIREARDAAGLSQAEFARRVGLKDAASAWRWESGRAEPSLAMLRRIASVTDADLGWLAGGVVAA